LSACATPQNKLVSTDFQAPTERTRVVVMRPDVRMSLITTGGLQEPRADWTAQAETNVLAALTGVLNSRGHDAVSYDANVGAPGRQDQLILLHEAVGASILQPVGQLVVAAAVPTKTETFDWTLGAGAVELGEAYDADFALFTTTNASFASGGRVAAAVATAVVTAVLTGGAAAVAPDMSGSQWMQASLVDLRTGEIVWMNVVLAGDPREPAGAQALIDRVTADLPL
jgi:hypothetical protein